MSDLRSWTADRLMELANNFKTSSNLDEFHSCIGKLEITLFKIKKLLLKELENR